MGRIRHAGYRRRLTLAASLAFSLSDAAVLHADPIPQEWLQEQHASCVFACRKSPANNATDCENACTCAGKETGTLLSREEYIAIERTRQTNRKLPVDLAEKLRTIDDRCAPDPAGL